MRGPLKAVYAALTLGLLWAPASGGQQPATMSPAEADFQARRAAAFEALRGQPFVQGYVSPNPWYTRPQSYAYLSFAFRCFWNDEMNAEANAAVDAHCDLYVDKLEAMVKGDSYYWAAYLLCAMIEYYGSHGRKAPGRLDAAVEAKALRMMRQYAAAQSKLAEAEFAVSHTWDVWGSENHHAQRFYVLWHTSKLLCQRPEYAAVAYADGGTPAEHYTAWTAYIKEWIRERARKGLFVEFANDGYNTHVIKALYCFYDFSDDPALRALAGKLLDLFWADWGQEQLNGVRGGAKARIYQGADSIIGDDHAEPATDVAKMLWYYCGLTQPGPLSGHPMTFVTSAYRPPAVVLDIMADVDGRGTYGNRQRRLGLAKDGRYNPPDYRLNEDEGLVRMTYCTPDFVLGGFHCEARPERDWTMISSQNRWVGAIFRTADRHSRVFIQSELPAGQRASYNAVWCVQSKGALIAQQLVNPPHGPKYSKYAEACRVWVSDDGLTAQRVANGWAFLQYGSSYAALRPAWGAVTWREEIKEGLWRGRWMTLADASSPVVLDVARASDYPSFEAFVEHVSARPLVVAGQVVTYHTSYDETLTLFADYSRLPQVNGRPVDLQPTLGMDSPFVRSVFNSGVCVIAKGDGRLTLDFNDDRRAERP